MASSVTVCPRSAANAAYASTLAKLSSVANLARPAAPAFLANPSGCLGERLVLAVLAGQHPRGEREERHHAEVGRGGGRHNLLLHLRDSRLHSIWCR